MSNKEKIQHLRGLGFSYNEISNELGVSKSLVNYHLTKNGDNSGLNKKNEKLTQEKINEINKLFNLGVPKIKISKELNLGYSTIKKYTDLLIKKTPEEVRFSQYERHKNWRINIKIKGVEYLGGKCNRCGYNNCIAALDFHHKDSDEKEFNITGGNLKSFEKIKSELDKCELLCANCHREHHNPQLIGIL